MTNVKHPQTEEQRVNPIIAGIAGAAVGVGIAVAATSVMKDEKTRKKVKDALDTVKGHALDYVDSVKTQMAGEKEILEIKAKEARKKVKKTVASATKG
jgi:hypothetical protein